MRSRRLVIHLGLATLGTAFIAAPALAQSGDAGQYQILGARYGTQQDNVDVTERLRDLARQDRQLRIDNRMFGIDPAHNQVKTLRIYARGPRGDTRTFEYREGSYVDGAQFTGWERGDWHAGNGWNGGWAGGPDQDGRPGHDDGEFLILHARYGTASRNIDVTDRLRELAQRDKNFRVKNDVFGIDPAPHEVKVLRIHARGPGGAVRVFDYTEGGYVDGNQFTGWGRGDWGRERWRGGWEGENRR